MSSSYDWLFVIVSDSLNQMYSQRRKSMYEPDPKAASVLGTAAQKLRTAVAIPNNFHPALKFLAKLGSGEVFFDSALELDTDGWPDGADAGDPDWQPDTSLRLSDHSSLDANSIPYFVLPLPPSWSAQFGIQLGDFAAVVFGDQAAFAVLGDWGPRTKIAFVAKAVHSPKPPLARR
jgi:hypothetical protein